MLLPPRPHLFDHERCISSIDALLSNYFCRHSSVAAFQTADKSTLVLVRHGESTWNLENKFTGWVDVPLSPKGEKEVAEAGQLIKESGIVPEVAFTSLQKRAIMTLNAVLAEVSYLFDFTNECVSYKVMLTYLLLVGDIRLILCGSR